MVEALPVWKEKQAQTNSYTEAPTAIFYACGMQQKHKLLHLVAVNIGVA